MEIKESAMQLLFTNPNLRIASWNEDNGWSIINKGCDSLGEIDFVGKGIAAFIDNVSEAERTIAGDFAESVKLQKRKVVERNTQQMPSLYFNLKNNMGGYQLYKVDSYFSLDVSKELNGVLLVIQEASEVEKYRISLALTVTNDKNPVHFANTASELMSKYPNKKYAIIQFDISRFKMINEQYGEEFGDELLKYVVHMLEVNLGMDRLYTRLTADVFMIITPFDEESELLDLVEDLKEKIEGYKDIAYRVYFGICIIEDTKAPIRKYGDRAATARQSVKGNALEYVEFYRDDMKDKASIRKYVEDNMEHALKNKEFIMLLQPKYSISEDQIIGAEALVRWKNEKYGMISPMDFVPIFEQNGFVVKMDAYIWEAAARSIREWLDKGIKPVPISVNMSRKHLMNDKFVKVLNELCARYNIPKEYLEIELTETIDEDNVIEAINKLKECGFTLLMDDFGSGYSSLNTLKDTQFDVIKIDRDFLKDFIDSERGRSIVEHTIKMTKDIGLDLIAEGVETKEQALFLMDCGCDKAQGFYYAKPMSLEEFNEKYMK